MTTQPNCKERINKHYQRRIADLSKLFRSWQSGNDESDEELGTFNEYGPCFEYVAPGTFSGQRRGYFRYLLSTGSPGDELRFYCDENLNPTHIEYWFLDWFDGAKKILNGKEYELMDEIFQHFKECGVIQAEFARANI